MGKFIYNISEYTPISNFTTLGLFEHTYIQSTKSALDDWIDKRISLFKLIQPYHDNITNLPFELTNMVLLGCVSAVESYFRKIIRSIINVDSYSRKKCEELNIKFGAILSQKDLSILPEALLEEYSFADSKNIKETIKKLLDINCNQINQVDEVLNEFTAVCQLRHCIVHRFGMLGTNNAIKLGLTEHKEYIEKPLKIDFDHLNEMVQVCENVVKVMNNYLFSSILERTYTQNIENWTGDFRTDKKVFKKYFNLFKDSSRSVDEKGIYKDYINTMKSLNLRRS
jgi:hypothetical protein